MGSEITMADVDSIPPPPSGSIIAIGGEIPNPPSGSIVSLNQTSGAIPPPPTGTAVPVSAVSPEPTLQERIGSLVPEAAAPALAWLQKNINEPLNKMAQKGSDVGSAALSGLLKLPLAAGGSHITQPVAEQPSPVTTGIAEGIGSVAGGAVADPRNWPFLASGAARPLLQRVISGGFGATMGNQAISTAQDLHANWDKYSPEQRAEKITQGGLTALMSAGALTHAATGERRSNCD
jgi:hypothetical protein